MGKRKCEIEHDAANRGIAFYFRGCVSNTDNRQLIYAAVIDNKPDSSGKKLRYLSCSIDGEIIVDYQVGRGDNFITNQLDKLPGVLPNLFQLFVRENERYSEVVNPTEKSGMTALYCRAASSSLLDAGAIETQRSTLQSYAKQQGIKDYIEYLDNGFSGNTLDRPAFARLNADIQAGKIATVVVRSIDRVARNYPLCDNWICGMRERGVKLIAIDGSHETVSVASDTIKALILNERRVRGNRVKK